MTQAGRQTTSRRELARHQNFSQVSPEVGELDELAVDEAMQSNPDDMLGMIADLTAATDPKLRELARRLAGRLMLDLGRSGLTKPRGVGRMTERPYQPDAGDLDIDASLDALNEMRHGISPDPDRLRVRGWTKPGVALCLIVDRSGSMGGKPLATAAIAAAAVACRTPSDYSVLAFGKDIVVAKSQDIEKSSDAVVNDVLTLRGFGTTDLAGALIVANQQLSRSRAGRRVAVLLSDCRATVEGDVEAAARCLEELVIIAPEEDAGEARLLSSSVGARLTLISGPSQIPEALARALE